MVTSIARQSVIIKCNMQKSVLTGNYEFYYAAGLIAKLSGVEFSEDIKPIELGEFVHQEIEKYFTLIVIAAFADMVAGTFNAYETVDGVTKLSAQATVNGAARKHLPAIYRFCCCLRTAPEKTAVERLERNGTRPCLHCCSLCNRHECTACNKQSNLDLSGICLHLSCRCPSDVASDAAA